MIQDRIILGIDPGTIVMGYGLLQIENNKPKLETMGVLQLNKYEDHYLRLRKIFERVLGLIDQYHPDEWAIEAPFFGKNVQSIELMSDGRILSVSNMMGMPAVNIIREKQQEKYI